ncbi:MAG: 2-oxoglutarate oxidoreductase [Ardenticatenaceae bacterium]|nr:2-oxoglutarate oxidoreductase [Anaerolineales bacterium]MCB8923892.1 2-oxoglutarate oxidoreductase [Ardenticatenaceae bacterium]MCB8990463.1 2-oxoglutarate oxidoreductase [Ardenticatenaceae bacterium]MCB9003477.1 2-oxoglutarate oxidoreductase [Ardenticatenaceae bacterium]
MATLTADITEKLVYQRPDALADLYTHYCPGCTHGTAHRLVAEVLSELGMQEDAVLVASVGCSVFSYKYFDVDAAEAAHGRACAMATGVKRVNPDKIVFTYQGDGDLASIGLAETMHAAIRGENITVIFLNNAIYGMTGGQMAPTTLPGQHTTSSPFGRDIKLTGNPIHIAEILGSIPGTAYSVRRSMHDARHVIQAKKAIQTAFEAQQKGLGFSVVELLSSCPTNWKMTPNEALSWVRDNMVPTYPLGDYKVHEELQSKRGRGR